MAAGQGQGRKQVALCSRTGVPLAGLGAVAAPRCQPWSSREAVLLPGSTVLAWPCLTREVLGAELTPGSQASVFQGPWLCQWCGVGQLGLAINSQEVISLFSISFPLLPAVGGLFPAVCPSILAVVPSDPACLLTPGHGDGGEGLQ